MKSWRDWWNSCWILMIFQAQIWIDAWSKLRQWVKKQDEHIRQRKAQQEYSMPVPKSILLNNRSMWKTLWPKWFISSAMQPLITTQLASLSIKMQAKNYLKLIMDSERLMQMHLKKLLQIRARQDRSTKLIKKKDALILFLLMQYHIFSIQGETLHTES